jgi:transcriptional regulator with XRE-family HTH domain
VTFGKHIRYLRLVRNMSVDDLASDTDLRLGHLLDLEAGRTVPSLEDIWKLAGALDVAEEELVEQAPRVRPDVL